MTENALPITRSHGHQPSLPLAGLRVLDLSRVLAGPLCTMTLGDLGADVLKVERPTTGDETRGWGPPFDSRGEAAYYLAVNRNKLSIALDFTVAADSELLTRLILEADVVVENFLPGVLARHGFERSALLDAAPDLVWCTISGFGPDSDRPGYDFVAQAESGWMAISGEPSGAPMKVGVALADVIAGKDAVIGVLAALARRGARGRGAPASERHVVVTLLQSATAALVNVAQNVLVSGHDAERWGNAHPNLCPYQLFQAADGWIVIAVGSDAQWGACARALGLTDLEGDPALKSNAGRLAARDRVVASVSARVRQASVGHWQALLEGAGVPCGAVRSVREALADVAASAQTGVAPLAPAAVRRAPPTLDEHGAIVRRLGWRAFADSPGE